MPRPPVDVVVPFAGSVRELQAVLARLEQIDLSAGDRILLADNRPAGSQPVRSPGGSVRVVSAPGIRSSYYARNRAVSAGDAEWLLFVDADVEWSADVLEAYFDPAPGERTAVLAGTIEDAPLAPDRRATVAERYALSRRTMSDQNPFDARGRPPYAQTANCFVRRAAYDAVGGFADYVRSGGDADLCFRLLAAGWRLERRTAARVVHRNRRSVPALIAQKARHGSGAAWLDRRHPGTFPPRGLIRLAGYGVRAAATHKHAAQTEDRATTLLDIAAVWAFELGRLIPNQARGLGAT